MDNTTIDTVENESNQTNTSRIFTNPKPKPDSDTGKNNYYTIVLVGLGVVIYGIMWLRRKRNREKYIAKREQEYLEYYHKTLPQSRIYGDISNTNSLSSMVESYHGTHYRRVSIQHGLADIAGFVLNVSQIPGTSEENADGFRHFNFDGLGQSREEYREGEASVNLHNPYHLHNGDGRDGVDSQNSYDSTEEMGSENFQYSYETFKETYKENRDEPHNVITSDLHNDVSIEHHGRDTSNEKYYKAMNGRSIHANGEITCEIHSEIESKSHCVETANDNYSEKKKVQCVMQNETPISNTEVHRHDRSVNLLHNIKERDDQLTCQPHTVDCVRSGESMEEGDDEVFTITQYTHDKGDNPGTHNHLNPGTHNPLNITDINIEMTDQTSRGYSVLNKMWPIHYIKNPNTRTKWKDKNSNFIQPKKHLIYEHELDVICNGKKVNDKHEMVEDKSTNNVHCGDKLTLDKQSMCIGHDNGKDSIDKHIVEHNGDIKMESNVQDFTTCTWI